MPIVLSLSETAPTLWAAGPDGLFRQDVDDLSPVAQPQTELTACLAIGDHVLVGGAPYGVAFSPDGGQGWQQSYAAGDLGLALCFATAPDVAESGILLTGTDGAGVWRSRDLGRSWTPSHVGLSDSSMLCLEWAPPAPAGRWPAWETVFAGGERGVFRSPNGGRAWKASTGINCIVQCLATGPDFQHTGEVLAGSEGDGLWRSTDGGRTFEHVPDTPAQINALAPHAGGWVLSDEAGLWRSPDGLTWQRLPGTEPALVLLTTSSGLFAGGMQGVSTVS